MVWCVLQRLLNADLILGEKLKINTPFKAHKQKTVKHYLMLFGSTTTTTTPSLFQIKYSSQSLCPQLVKIIRGGYKRKKKIL